MNKGTREGTEAEINFVRKMNKKEDDELWDTLKLDHNNHYAVHVKYHKFGKIHQKKIKPKADVFIVEGNIPEDYLKLKDYFIDEDDLERFNLTYVKYSGISIKREDSKNYQILKASPSAFNALFGSFELGAGVSIYVNQKELIKNTDLLKGWNTNPEKFKAFFEEKCEVEIKADNGRCIMSLTDARKIKKYSRETIKELIEKNDAINKYVFQGIGNFEEPFTVHYLYKNGKLSESCYIPYNVTTGSGRTKGTYTIAIKPKK